MAWKNSKHPAFIDFDIICPKKNDKSYQYNAMVHLIDGKNLRILKNYLFIRSLRQHQDISESAIRIQFKNFTDRISWKLGKVFHAVKAELNFFQFWSILVFSMFFPKDKGI